MNQLSDDFVIREIEWEEVPAAIDFVMDIIREVFPMLDPNALPPDMVSFREVYYRSDRAAFLAAFDKEGAIAATAAFLGYDDRIREIKGRYPRQTTAELVKCYVKPELRHQGIGTRMVERLLPLALGKGYETMYLHTHRFLPGAVRFWEKQGFCFRLEPFDSFETVHMDKLLLRA
ncbi:GNAT family N-acetyltransferase [Paenibacillus doosanensis]|uniref:Acetyltransferase (GNAT) family protein n=1 Tax=Paenibacillus konkukensis TaxID=2020716 RepID=A0ABY4RG78_9BACL|nr:MULTISPECIES: GNAT family N-acetyltransferase [Paenibacillus]MCS7464017.1 GNAT family N-acetyltransferase [Paenibacillus doosanensis]UQZ81387.1 Acetyltransferase (GNAT) family protein [Paenibacillus konkukensis]